MQNKKIKYIFVQVYDGILPVRVLLLEEVERDYMLLFMDHREEKQNKQAIII
jgi:hypothetical protein